jgi:hypothetical protein
MTPERTPESSEPASHSRAIARRRERLVRWEERRIAQFSQSINLLLGFSLATLGFEVNVAISSTALRSPALDLSIIWIASSLLFGTIATFSRLLDYRATAAWIRIGSPADKREARLLGRISWVAFWAQGLTYLVGAALFLELFIRAF